MNEYVNMCTTSLRELIVAWVNDVRLNRSEKYKAV